jgi:hypothetical protein
MIYSYDRTAAGSTSTKKIIQKWIDQAEESEKELIPLVEKILAGLRSYGKGSTHEMAQVANSLDDAIDAFAKAKGALVRANLNLR